MPKIIDERFLTHRLRATSIGGQVAVTIAMLLFAYRYYHDHHFNADLLAVGIAAVVVKVGLTIWYRVTD